MSKDKTALKFATAILLLGGSIAAAVLYFPYVALAIKFGVVFSTAPLAIFAISAIVALASAITLTVFTVSAVRNKDDKGKPNEVDGESISKNEEEGQSLVQEKKQAVPTPMPELLPQEPKGLVTSLQPGDNPVEGIEAPQPKESNNVVVSGDDAGQTEESLPSLPPSPTASPLNSLSQFQSFPSPPPISRQFQLQSLSGWPSSNKSAYNILRNNLREPMFVSLKLPDFLRGTSNASLSDSYSSMTSEISLEELPSVPMYTSPLNSMNQSESFSSLPIFVQLNAALAEHEQQKSNQTDSTDSEEEFDGEQRYYELVDRRTGQPISLDSYNHNWVANHLDSFDDSSYYDSTVPNSILSSNNVHAILSRVQTCLPDDALQGIGADPNDPNASNKDYESFNNYPALVPQCCQNSESGPRAMLWSVNNQQYLSMQSLGSSSRNNGF